MVTQSQIIALRRVIIELTHAIVIAERHPSLVETKKIAELALEQAKRDYDALVGACEEDANADPDADAGS